MAPRNPGRPAFDRLTIFLHWATALLVLAMFASAWLHGLAEGRNSVFSTLLLQLHRSLGITIWVATGLRLAWRLTNAKLPPFPSNMTKLHRAIVQSSEYGLYALLLVQPSTGMGATLLAGVHSLCSCGRFHNWCPKTRRSGPRFIWRMNLARGRLGPWSVAMPPSSPADIAKSASTVVFQGIKRIHSRSC
jgi:cytochrome b561